MRTELNLALLRFADAVVSELFAAAVQSQKNWGKLFSHHASNLEEIVDQIQDGQLTHHHPLVRDFILFWVNSMTWSVIEIYPDGLRLEIPATFLEPLVRSGQIESLEFYMADRGEVCCASLGNNDHDRKFGLFINYPVWLQIASLPAHLDLFGRQLKMVIHHEMAHFHYKEGGLRAEQMAHCRGVGSLIPYRDFPSDANSFKGILIEKYPEAWHILEFRDFVENQANCAFRLVRIWSYLNSQSGRVVMGDSESA